jgi:hypothetical protein
MNKLMQTVVFGICISTLSPSVLADNKALERAQYMLRLINSQKVQLEQQNVGLKKELDALKKESAKQIKKQKAGNKKLGMAGKKKDKYILKLKDKLRETLIALRKSEKERLQANNIGQSLDSELKQCVDNNHSLVLMNDKLVDNYTKKGCWDAILQDEPFTGINQVKVENILQEYRFENEDLKVNQATEYQQSGGSASVVEDSEEAGS